jgi:hypothetical protein
VSSTDNNQRPAGFPLWQRTKAKQVSELLTGVLSDVLARRSGMTLDLLASWENIVGPDYADWTMPEKITWPRRADDGDPFKPGGLIVACDGAKAVFFQHETIQILERVNHFFGYQAIDRIRIVQKPVQRQKRSAPKDAPLAEPQLAKLEAILAEIIDPELRRRLEAFGKGVYSRKNEREKD